MIFFVKKVGCCSKHRSSPGCSLVSSALQFYFLHINSQLAEATFISDTFIRRVSLTYRVKSAHKVKLTDKQLLQWMVPILLVMLIFLGTWTVSSPPYAEVITDSRDLKFYQCSYNWWDHSLAIGKYKRKKERKTVTT